MRFIAVLMTLLLIGTSPVHASDWIEQYKAAGLDWDMIVQESNFIATVGEGYGSSYCTLAAKYDRYMIDVQKDLEKTEILLVRPKVVFHTLTESERRDLKAFLDDLGVRYRDADRRCRR